MAYVTSEALPVASSSNFLLVLLLLPSKLPSMVDIAPPPLTGPPDHARGGVSSLTGPRPPDHARGGEQDEGLQAADRDAVPQGQDQVPAGLPRRVPRQEEPPLRPQRATDQLPVTATVSRKYTTTADCLFATGSGGRRAVRRERCLGFDDVESGQHHVREIRNFISLLSCLWKQRQVTS